MRLNCLLDQMVGNGRLEMKLDCMEEAGVKADMERTARPGSQPYVIEKGVPVAPRRSLRMQPVYEAMMACDVGDSFFISLQGANRNTLSVSIHRYQQNMGRQFVVRRQGEGVRVWRIA